MARSPDPPISRHHWHAVTAGFLGWTLDAFDFFVVVFMVDRLALEFHVDKSAIIWTLTATLATRPLGAVIFGLLADRYGRRIPLIANVLYFSLIELLCGFAPNYTVFLILRLLFGIGMGGEWGVGSSLAMEAAPPRWRGVLSGLLQNGYAAGYLLAALASRFVLPIPGWGWRAMFWTGGLPALLALYIRARVPESEAWKQHRAGSTRQILRVVAGQWKLFAYLALLMTVMMCLSHGTQDLYPDFLKTVHRLKGETVAYMAILYNLGAIAGGVTFGHLSERAGRRRAMQMALALSLVVMPLWAFGGGVTTLVIGAVLMQAGVQGAWGIIPAHLNELAPDAARGLMPGLAYQLGILFAAPTNTVEYWLRDTFGYQWALAGFEICVISLIALTLVFGRERRGRAFVMATAQPTEFEQMVHEG